MPWAIGSETSGSIITPAAFAPLIESPEFELLVDAKQKAGLRALCVPCGFSTEGLPLALQFVGPPFSENLLLSLGAWFQSRTDWHQRRPPLPSF